MAKKNSQARDGARLFEQQERAHERRVRRQRALFIPRFLRDAAKAESMAGAPQDRAHAVILRWSELERTGKLPAHKETSIDTQFLDQIFVEGLGYELKTLAPDAWTLEHKFTVSGVGTADAALGLFPRAKSPSVVIELKDANTDLDRDRFGGRTPVNQCWDYLNALPDCEWGIVSNFSTIRLYHKSKGTLNYEEFTLEELRDRDRFNDFYCIFERGGLLQSKLKQIPRALQLLEKTERRQKEVGDALYESYQLHRLRLIEHLIAEEGKHLDEAIRIAQKILDRIIFIAFCEDRGLLPTNTLESTRTDVRRYSRAANPAWENFLALFEAIDKGAKGKVEITAFNGGLFEKDDAIDSLDLDDHKWAEPFANFGQYDFSEEVNVEVLGHLFERSITELEKLRVGGLFALKTAVEGADAEPTGRKGAKGRKKQAKKSAQVDDSPLSKMPKSAQRKRFGIYYTPPAFTGLIVERTVDALIRERFDGLAIEHKVDPEAREVKDSKRLRAYWHACLAFLKSVTVCDPACGSGAFLIRAYEALDVHYKSVVRGLAAADLSKTELDAIEDAIPECILAHNLYGVDLSHEAVEITQLALWIRSARKGRTLANLSANIIHGNSLVSDKSVDPHAFDWRERFPAIFGKGGPGGFSCVIGNPPWERVKVQDREFFALTDPITAGAVSAADRKKRIAVMPEANPELHESYLAARDRAQRMLDFARSGAYPLTGKGDINLYMLFAELARSIVAPQGIVGLLVPSGIATDDTTKEFFGDLMDSHRLISLFDFENREKVFEDVDGRFKFTAIVFGGVERRTEAADFVFFARSVEETSETNKQRHIALSAADMSLLNPNTKTCPIFRTRRDADLTRAIYRRIPILIDEGRKTGGNPWGIKFLRMFDQTNDAEHFQPRKAWERKKYALEGNVFVKGKRRALPLYEAKMVQAFDHRAASVMVEEGNWVRQGQKDETTRVQYENPEYAVLPRWWVADGEVERALEGQPGVHTCFLGFKDITSPTNERTMIASFVPRTAVTNKFVLALSGLPLGLQSCLLANLNSFAFDYVTRQKIGAITLNFFIVEQLPALPPSAYADPCPWSKQETLEQWISERVLKLSCTAEDMIPLAQACGFAGSRGDGVHIWKEGERFTLRAELDAAYFILYGIERADVEYILSTFTNTGFVAQEDRLEGQGAWKPDGMGHAILEAYDHFSGLGFRG